MTSSERLAVQRAKTVVAPDDRVACLEVDIEVRDDRSDRTTVVLAGTVQTDRIRRAVVDEVERASAHAVDDELSVLGGTGEPRTTDRRVLPVRGEPDDDAEQVTKVLYGAELTAYDDRDGWRRVRTPGGYLAWVDAEALTDGRSETDGWNPDAVVVATPSDAIAVDEANLPTETVPAGVDCRLESDDGDEATVSFRTGARATLPAESVRETTPRGTGEDVVAAARRFLETPYEWGGMTAEGIDCSGLAWVSYATVGVSLPRDANQQEAMGADVDRDDLAPGDLLFFPGHVAISLGGNEYIHASGSAEEVTINSFDPDDERYIETLDEELSGTKRLLER